MEEYVSHFEYIEAAGCSTLPLLVVSLTPGENSLEDSIIQPIIQRT